jgi:hypothetical protein
MLNTGVSIMNGQDLLQELQALVSEEGLIGEETYRRLLLTSMISVLTKLDSIAENPMVSLGDFMRKHPKIFGVGVIVLVFLFPYIRQVLYQYLGIPIPNIP